MEKTNLYHLIILDESGSMESIRTSIISSMMEIIQDIQHSSERYPDLKHFISLISFNSSGIRSILDKVGADGLTNIDVSLYRPNGGTPLYDAMGRSLIHLQQHLYGRQDTHVSVTILTDGYENASNEFDHRDIRILVESLKQKGWDFIYIGAEHDVLKVTKDLAIDKSISFSKSADSLRNTIREHSLMSEEVYSRVSKYKKG